MGKARVLLFGLKCLFAALWAGGVSIECASKPFKVVGVIILTLLFVGVIVIVETIDMLGSLYAVEQEERSRQLNEVIENVGGNS